MRSDDKMYVRWPVMDDGPRRLAWLNRKTGKLCFFSQKIDPNSSVDAEEVQDDLGA